MSKISNSVSVDFANVHWFKDTNIRVSDKSWGDPLADVDYRETTDDEGNVKITSKAPGSDRALVYLMRDGWDQSQGIVSAWQADAKTAAAAIEDRKAILKRFEEEEGTASLAVALREVWFPEGKPAKVEWIANNCFRRSRGIMGVLLRRKRDNPANWDTHYVIPVEPKQFGTGEAGELAKLVNHILENTLKTAGRKELQAADYFYQAVAMRRIKGDKMKESDLIRLNIKRGEAQRAFALATLDARFPELHLQERCKGNPPKPYVYEKGKSWLDVASLRHADVVRLNNCRNPETTDDKPIPGGRKGWLDTIEAYLEKAMTGGKVQPITSKQIGDAAKASPCLLLQYLAAKIENKDGNFAALFTEHADKINKAMAFLAKLDAAYAKLVEDNEEKPAEKAA
jgi:hypothetical protein